MAKDLDFRDYTAHYQDEDGDDHSHTVRAHVVTDETARVKNPETGNLVKREVMTPTGARIVAPGDVLVATERPGVYDHLTASAWATTGYADDVADGVADDDDDADDDA